MNNYVKGYKADAGLDIVLDEILLIQPGFQTITLPATYTPANGEVAFLVPRGSTAAKGIFPIMVAIDAGYTGKITAWVYNMSGERHIFDKGDRVFGIVNLKLGEDRAEFTIAKEGERGNNKLASSGGHSVGRVR